MIDLKPFIVEVPDFPKPGILFRDISQLLRHHLNAVTDALTRLVEPQAWANVDALAGIESRGFVLAAALAAHRGKGLIMVRKKGRLPPPTVHEAYSLEYGTDALEVKPGSGRVFLVDDVLATGGTMRAAANLCRTAGYDVKGLLVLIDLKLVRHFEWMSLPVRSAIQYD